MCVHGQLLFMLKAIHTRAMQESMFQLSVSLNAFGSSSSSDARCESIAAAAAAANGVGNGTVKHFLKKRIN
jgi:hypothetical protein